MFFPSEKTWGWRLGSSFLGVPCDFFYHKGKNPDSPEPKGSGVCYPSLHPYFFWGIFTCVKTFGFDTSLFGGQKVPFGHFLYLRVSLGFCVDRKIGLKPRFFVSPHFPTRHRGLCYAKTSMTRRKMWLLLEGKSGGGDWHLWGA